MQRRKGRGGIQLLHGRHRGEDADQLVVRDDPGEPVHPVHE
jgi:hypothetical protein